MKEPRHFGRIAFVLLALPAIGVVVFGASDILRGTRYFGSNPVKEIEHTLGLWCLRLLALTLCVTPARELFGWNWLAKHRRTFGLFAFGYGALHWCAYAFLDLQLDLSELATDLAKRPYIIVGSAALTLMTPLALTSSAAMIRRLGGRTWNRLHSLVYVVAILGTIHFWMSVKQDVSEPLMYAAVFAILFSYRIARRFRGRPAS